MARQGSKRLAVAWLLSLAALAFLAGCSDGDGDGPGGEYWALLYDWSDPATWTDPSLWSDNKLRSFAYSGSRGHPYYENTISVRSEADKWIELSTGTRDSALAWSEASATSSSTYRDLISESETEKYHEFRRVHAAHPGDVMLSRVHKSSYLDRAGARDHQGRQVDGGDHPRGRGAARGRRDLPRVAPAGNGSRNFEYSNSSTCAGASPGHEPGHPPISPRHGNTHSAAGQYFATFR